MNAEAKITRPAVCNIYQVVRCEVSGWLKSELDINVTPANILCPSKFGDFSANIAMVFELNARQTAQRLTKSTMPATAWGVKIAEVIWEQGSYINFTISDDMSFAIMEQVLKVPELHPIITNINTLPEYMLARMRMIRERETPKLHTKQALSAEIKRSIWLCCALVDNTINGKHTAESLPATKKKLMRAAVALEAWATNPNEYKSQGMAADCCARLLSIGLAKTEKP